MVLCGCIPYLSQGYTYRKYGAAYNAGRYGTDKKDIKEILDFAYENKVDYVKFLELLVTEDLIKKDMYKFYLTLDSLLNEWKNELEKLKLEKVNLNEVVRRRVNRFEQKSIKLVETKDFIIEQKGEDVISEKHDKDFKSRSFTIDSDEDF